MYNQRYLWMNVYYLHIFEKENVVGSITERTIIKAQTNRNKENVLKMPITKLMEPPFPIVDASTIRSALANFLHHHQAVLVAKKGKIIGIVSRADILRR